MTHRTILTVALVALLAIGLTAPAVAAAPGAADECQNTENGPSDGGPPGFVADLVPDFLSDLLSGLPVPNFVKSAFGAQSC